MYAYCGNNPINRIDITGQLWLKLAIAITAAILTLVLTVAVCMPSKEEHYNRNKNQEEMIPDNPVEIITSKEWEEQPDDKNIYHRHTCGEQGERAKDNKKYMKDERYEVIINFSDPKNPKIVTDPYNIGTYNYGTNVVTHFLYDVAPYWRWGNSETDSSPSFMWDRIRGAQS